VGNVSTAQNQQLQSAASAAGLRIRLLGPIAITIMAGGCHRLEEAQALLGYLGAAGGTDFRNVPTGLCGESGENQERASLHKRFQSCEAA
jgi:hypothetical protein